MSTERMTDMDGWMRDVADAAASLDKRGDRQMSARLMRLHRDMDIARLRGDAAPEGQAVPCLDCHISLTGFCNRCAAELDECEDFQAALSSPAAPAPVAGDAVANLPEKFRNKADSLQFSGTWPGDYVADFVRDCADALEAALAQDRASQAGAAGVPEDRA